MDNPGTIKREISVEDKDTQAGPNRLILSMVLRGGVIISAALIVIGVVLFLITGQSGYAAGDLTKSQPYSTYHDITGSNQPLYFPTTPGEIVSGTLALKPFALIMLGLLVLIATPVLNLLLAGWGFLSQKNWAFTLITLTVLAILAISFLLANVSG